VDELNHTIAEYRRQADEIGEFLSSCPIASVVWPPGAGRWSILEITAHLADAELLASARIRRIITQDRPEMLGYQQELWARSLAYGQRKIETVSARLILLRQENAGLLETIGDEVWRLKGRRDEYGELSLRALIDDYITHTAKHLDQMRSAAAEFEASTKQTANAIARLRGTEMTKTKDKTPHIKDAKGKDTKDKGAKDRDAKDKELKGKSNLVGRVKKVIKKSRRKLGEEKFEKELQRTIEFLAQLQVKLDNSNDNPGGDQALEKAGKASVKRTGKNAEKKVARSPAKKAKPSKKSVKKTTGNGTGKKGKGAASQINDAAPAAETVIALQAETPSIDQ